MLTLGILGSGSGSNMQAILDAIETGTLQARIAIVLSDNPDGHILERAKANGIECALINCTSHRSKFPLEAQKETAHRLKETGVDLVCLAGFMRLVKAPLLNAFPGRILNVHPSLLPAFPGINAWEQALEAGASESGVTIHIVDSGMDTGPILAQQSVAILANDTSETLHSRIQTVEHELYPKVIGKYAATLKP
ncbi:MAG: phosphoribosylglycinamide formyltransferase [Luteolibacter sp.]